MFKGSGLRAAGGVLFAAFLLSACQSTPVHSEYTNPAGVLRYVPADTPYVFATGAPLPDATLDELEPKMERVLESYRAVLRELVLEVSNENEAGLTEEESGQFQAVIAEVANLLSIDGMRNAGFDRNARIVLYGHGVLPVLRIELSDAQRFEDTLTRMEGAAGSSMPIATIDGYSYRWLGEGEGSGRMVIATVDGQAVFTWVPGMFGDDELRQLLGLTLPVQNLAMAGTLQTITDNYGFADYYTGYIDIVRLARTFAEEARGLDARLLKGLGVDPLEGSEVCRAELIELAGAMPRIVFGYDTITAREMNAEMVLELRPDIATSLATVPAAVAGVGSDLGGLFSMGVGLNVEAMLGFYRDRLDAVIADPWECEHLQEAQQAAVAGRSVIDRPLPPFAFAFRGFNLLVDDVKGLDFESDAPPESVDASAVVAFEDAPTMFSMFSMMSPELAQLNLQPDGKPVKVEMPQLDAMAEAVYAAMLPNGIAMSGGANAKRRVTEVLNAPSAAVPPFLSITMDASRYYEFLGEAMMIPSEDEEEEMSMSARESLRDVMLEFARLYDRMAVDVRFTANGVSVTSRVTLSD